MHPGRCCLPRHDRRHSASHREGGGMTALQKVEKPFTVPNLAARWECSEGLIRKMIDRGELRSFRLGVLIRIPADDVERIECQTTQSRDSEERSPSLGTRMEIEHDAVHQPRIRRARSTEPGEGGRAG